MGKDDLQTQEAEHVVQKNSLAPWDENQQSDAVEGSHFVDGQGLH